jgi:hypothetical protein
MIKYVYSVLAAFVLLMVMNITVLAAPKVLKVAPQVSNSKTVKLAWDANTEPDLAGYKVYWGKASGGPYTNSPVPTVPVMTNPEYTTPELANGRWYFVVTAYNTGGAESGYSNEVTASINSAPNPPRNLRTVLQQVADFFRGIFTGKGQQ